MTPLDRVFLNLPTLSTKELKVVRSEVDRLLSEKEGTDTQLFQCLLLVLGLKIPFSRFASTSYHKHWVKNQSLVNDFINEFGLELTREQNYKLKLLLVGLVVDHLKKCKLDATIGQVVVGLANIPDLFRHAYPGYIENGLGCMVVKALTKGG